MLGSICDYVEMLIDDIENGLNKWMVVFLLIINDIII